MIPSTIEINLDHFIIQFESGKTSNIVLFDYQVFIIIQFDDFPQFFRREICSGPIPEFVTEKNLITRLTQTDCTESGYNS